jgi:hypothetical protein
MIKHIIIFSRGNRTIHVKLNRGVLQGSLVGPIVRSELSSNDNVMCITLTSITNSIQAPLSQKRVNDRAISLLSDAKQWNT